MPNGVSLMLVQCAHRHHYIFETLACFEQGFTVMFAVRCHVQAFSA